MLRKAILLVWSCLGLLSVTAQPVSKEPEPPQKPFVLRAIDWGYRIIEGDSAHPRKRLILVFPILSYKPETRWIFGITAAHFFRVTKDSITRPSFLRVNVSYSQNEQFAVIPQFEYFSRGNKINIKGKYTYTDFGEYYFGMGLYGNASRRELYSFGMHRANLKVGYQFVPNLYAGVQYNIENLFDFTYPANGFYASERPNGFDGYKASGVGGILYYDNRDHVYFPHNGQIIELSNVFYNQVFGSGYRFMNMTLDARKYVHLWKENVLALQGVVQLNEGDIPFRMAGTLGSDVYMRGYYNGRYRDKHAMAFQAELRKTIWGPVTMVFFAGGGTVSNNKLGLLNEIKPNYGLGLRVKAIPKERVNFRIDYGFGSPGNEALYISLNEAF